MYTYVVTLEQQVRQGSPATSGDTVALPAQVSLVTFETGLDRPLTCERPHTRQKVLHYNVIDPVSQDHLS